jgi:hypothetical protein
MDELPGNAPEGRIKKQGRIPAATKSSWVPGREEIKEHQILVFYSDSG